ncbi:hypothetical protein V6N11_009709 [Hibiscus sabdariffa]|uniref:Integrase catalytic domain-containing protein n=1 Tax=Hibiscus sabdariffa TaxID=183260 RepID=A0ABR2P6Q7_9ROSI
MSCVFRQLNRRLNQMFRLRLLPVMFLLNDNNMPAVCSFCLPGKAHKLPFQLSSTEYDSPFQLVVSDVWGPSHIDSDGFYYYVSFIDVFSWFTWLYLIKRKSDVYQCFLNFHKMIEVQFQCKVKALQTDGGTEYLCLIPWLNENGVVHRVSCPNTSEQNGKSERKHRHVVEMGLMLLAQAELSLSFWSHAFVTTVFLINRLLTPVFDRCLI